MVNNNTTRWLSLLLPLLWPSLIVLNQQPIIVKAEPSFGGGDGDNNNNEEELIRLKIKFADVNERAQFQDTMIHPRFSTSTKEEEVEVATLRTTSSTTASWYDFQDVYQFSRTNMTALSIPKAQYASFMNIAAERNIQVSVDRKMRTFQINDEVLPYGIEYTQGDRVNDEIPSPPAGGPCFKVCVIDDGLLVTHPDIPYQLGDATIEGQRFGLPSNKQWWNPSPQAAHGTHVAVSTTGVICQELQTQLPCLFKFS